MPDKLPGLKAQEVVRALLRMKFYIHHQTGSHARLLHKERPELRVTVPIHSKDLPLSLLKRILKQASVSEEDFLRPLWKPRGRHAGPPTTAGRNNLLLPEMGHGWQILGGLPDRCRPHNLRVF